MGKTLLILGITGGLGHACAHAFAARGWRLKALHRAPERAATGVPDLEVDWHRGDALDRRAVRDAARGADLILHGVNPPGYRRWAELAPAMLENSLAAARAEDARLLFPANVYNYTPNPGTPLAEDAPQAPVTRKGRVRQDLEQRLARAAEGGTRVLLVRAGDFFGAPAPASWFENVMVRAGRPLTRVVYPGDFEAGHAWAYLPDLAATFAELAEREAALPRFSRFHFAGHYLPRGVTSASRPDDRTPPSAACPGRRCGCWRRSTPRCGRCWRCATCGGPPWPWTTASWWPCWARNPTHPCPTPWRTR